MKVLIVNNAVPFVWGGAEELAANLTRKLNALKGVEAELLRVPFQWEPKERLLSEIVLNRNLELINVDRVIALKFPAYLIQHEHKTLWLLHQFRQAYDLLDHGQSYLTRGVDDELLTAIAAADNRCLDEAVKIFTNSPVTQQRLWHYNRRQAEVLYPPLNDEELFVPGPYGNYLFAGGRVATGKRQELLVEAARLSDKSCKLVIAGPADDAAVSERLHDLVEKYGLSGRVILQIGLHSRSQIAQLATNALACVYVPFQEDSLGYVTMEALASARAVITTRDAGGLLEIVKNDETGLVCDPTAQALADAFDRLFANRTSARTMGDRGRSVWLSRKITWNHTLDKLLS